uniref:hypothetical protein n=1 Tax=Amycolatopsis sp. CA-290885 TaxID=3239925 RepID=UPI003F497250
MGDWKISTQRGKTVVEVPDYGRFEIWTNSRGLFRRPRTHLEHTGQFDIEVPGFDSVPGGSHRRALRRLRRHVQEWATSPMPMRGSDQEGYEAGPHGGPS